MVVLAKQNQQNLTILHGHPTDRFGEASVWKALNPLHFSKGNFHLQISWYGKIKALYFRIDKNVVWGSEKRSAKIFGTEKRPKVFGEGQTMT